LEPTVEEMDSSPDGSAVLLDPQYWGERAWQLASLLQTGVLGPIGDPRGRRPELVATIADSEYWSHHVNELADAPLEPAP
jgi:hypothetical protein